MKTSVYDSKNIPLHTGEADIVRSCVLQKGHKVLQTSKRRGEGANRNAFTLAEVLITLGVIGVVAALTMPTLLTNIQERVRKEQVRTVKYKFTKATDKMNSLGKIGDYGDDEDATKNFVNELKNHLSIAKVCENGDLAQCWPSGGFVNAKGDYTAVSSLTTGVKLDALQMNSGSTKTMGIVTGDGTPIILVYGKDCQTLDEVKQYQWSTSDGKPVSNATAECVAAVFEINGAAKPNRYGDDVQNFNAGGLGSGCAIEIGSLCFTAPFEPKAMTKAEGEAQKDDLGIKFCSENYDRWAGAVKACKDQGKKLPTMAQLGELASQLYVGNPSIGAEEYKSNLKLESNSSVLKALGLTPIFYLWSSEEVNYSMAYGRKYNTFNTDTFNYSRNQNVLHAICVGD